MIAPEIRPVIKHAAHFSRRGCSDGSDAFVNFSYATLRNASVLSDDVTFKDFSPCDYLPHLQQVLFSTDTMDEHVTYETLVIVPESLKTSLHDLFGDEMKFNGPFVSYDANLESHDANLDIIYCFRSLIPFTLYLPSCWTTLDTFRFVASSISSMTCFQSMPTEDGWKCHNRNHLQR